MRWVGSWWAALFGALALVAVSTAQAAERRVALVLGNSAYSRITALTNPRNDAGDVAARLRDLGFEVMERSDFTRTTMNDVLRDYSRLAAGADVALVYYAGHALEHGDDYYLVPVDSAVDDSDAVTYETLPASRLDDILARVQGVRITIFDACRRDLTRDQATALANAAPRRQSAPPGKGEIRVFATAPLDVAEDGRARNSPFTRALLRQLDVPELGARTLFRNVARDVAQATQGRQNPDVRIALDGDFAFNLAESDLTRWAAIRQSSDPGDFRDFIARFPQSAYRADAQFRLDVLVRAARRIEERRAREAQRLEQERQAREAAERERQRIAQEADRARQEEARRVAEEERKVREAAERERQRIAQEDERRKQDEARRAAEEARRVAEEDRKAREAAERERQRIAQEEERKKRDEEEKRAALERACQSEKAQVGARANARDALQKIRRDAKCPATSDLVQMALAELEAREALAERRKRQEACTREADRVDELSRKGDLDNLNSLRGLGLCPDTPKRVDQALAVIAEKAERERQRLDREAKAREEICRAEAAAIEQAATAEERDELLTLKAGGKCPDSARKADLAVAAIDAKAKERERVARDAAEREATCRTEAAQVDELSAKGDADRLGELRAAGRCVDTARRADGALAALAERDERDRQRVREETARREETCRTEAAQIETLAKPGQGSALAAIEAGLKCPESRQRFADAAAAVQRFDREASCVAEGERIAAFGRDGRAPELTALKAAAKCPASGPRIETALAEISRRAADAQAKQKEACAAEATRVASIGQSAGAREALASLRSGAQCEATGRLVAEALTALDLRDKVAAACASDQSRFEALQAQGPEGQAGMRALVDATECADLKPRVLAALEASAAAPAEPQEPSDQPGPAEPEDATAEPVNTPAQIERAQKSLAKLGCYDGDIDASRLEDTKDALETFLKVKAEDPGDLLIDDQLIGRLEGERARVCPLECEDGEVAQGERCVPAQNRARTPRRDAPPAISREDRRQQQREERRAREERARERVRERAPTRVARPLRTERPAPAAAPRPGPQPRKPPTAVVDRGPAPKPKSGGSAIILGN